MERTLFEPEHDLFRESFQKFLAQDVAPSHEKWEEQNNDVVAPYLVDLCNDEQKQRWLPWFASGELISAIAMTDPEPAATCRESRPELSVTAKPVLQPSPA